MKAILLIDHGSVRAEANEMLACMANLVQTMVGERAIVRYAHMELAPPTIDEGFHACVEAGATEVVAFPYMLSPGKHSMGDIPRMVAAAAASHQGVGYVVTPPFGVHEKLAEVILMRADLEAERSITASDVCRCWNEEQQEGTCGNACRLRQATAGATPAAR
jgi:sirohydrochlorin ferrochelatase